MEFDTRCVKVGEPLGEAKALATAVSPLSFGNATRIPILGNYKVRFMKFQDYVKQGTKGAGSNEIVRAFESKMASLEECKYGIAFPSGS